ncbi:uncharacterized protein TRAVEDRAFT_54846 [Trametes versicolor FP-101664 SS1]|uniref:Uncharacterized protein n=1 Tax=Trametes versicolor (strain FP-101664) TaxID=717944 RepID=R7S6H4_TRAVS|nr:uncharacterized protein TRAVEDRAFT_54846 [Trametes versicolor FP-101664 SS1]EIW51150.1 hypothetical protein TRAVEDRAFT_54846 [Trametes versicolor FP-101664 SS1]
MAPPYDPPTPRRRPYTPRGRPASAPDMLRARARRAERAGGGAPAAKTVRPRASAAPRRRENAAARCTPQGRHTSLCVPRCVWARSTGVDGGCVVRDDGGGGAASVDKWTERADDALRGLENARA